MQLYFPVDLTGNLILIEKLVLGEIWTGDLPIFNPDALTSAPSRQLNRTIRGVVFYFLNFIFFLINKKCPAIIIVFF